MERWPVLDEKALSEFLKSVRGQAASEGARYARAGHVDEPAGSAGTVTTRVRGRGRHYDVALWVEDGALGHRCECPSWRDPCKHTVAAALVLAKRLRELGEEGVASSGELDDARERALAERREAAKGENLRIRLNGTSGFVDVESPSGYRYRVQLRGGADGPHGCNCPDFEANRLHTCKHVERVRTYLRSPRTELPRAAKERSEQARVYLHFGEVVEPRLFGRARGRGSRSLAEAFGADGRPLVALPSEDEALLGWLDRFGPTVEAEARRWLAERAARRPRLPAAGELGALLPKLGGEPYAFQKRGIEFLARSGRALLADEMGLGKTIQALLAATILRKAQRPVRSVTIVCPASLRGSWRDEIRRWLGEDAVLLEGRPSQRARSIKARPRWLITHYEQVLRDQAHHVEAEAELLIIDEAQRAKGISSKTARALKSIPARHVFALTGTPLENRLEEAYAIAQLIDQRLLPPLWQIERDHLVRDERGSRVMLYRNLSALRSRLAPAFLRRRKEDVAPELPERLRSISFLPLHPAVLETYEDVMAHVARIASGARALTPAELDRIQRLLVIARRCCNGPHMLGMEVDAARIPKLAELRHALVDLCLGEGRKVVVFSEWTDMTEAVERLVESLGIPVVHLRGSVPVKQRPALIRSFGEAEGAAVFVSTDAGGVGLNLQAADVVVNLDLPWNPARLEQRLARVHRIGARRPVQVLLLVAENSIEERLLGLHTGKRDLLENVWSSDGEDELAAPSARGAFAEVVRAMVGDPKEGPGSEPLSIAPERLAAAARQLADSLPDQERRQLARLFTELGKALESK